MSLHESIVSRFQMCSGCVRAADFDKVLSKPFDEGQFKRHNTEVHGFSPLGTPRPRGTDIFGQRSGCGRGNNCHNPGGGEQKPEKRKSADPDRYVNFLAFKVDCGWRMHAFQKHSLAGKVSRKKSRK